MFQCLRFKNRLWQRTVEQSTLPCSKLWRICGGPDHTPGACFGACRRTDRRRASAPDFGEVFASIFEEDWASSLEKFFSSSVESSAGRPPQVTARWCSKPLVFFRLAGLLLHQRPLPVPCALTLTASPSSRLGELGNHSQIIIVRAFPP